MTNKIDFIKSQIEEHNHEHKDQLLERLDQISRKIDLMLKAAPLSSVLEITNNAINSILRDIKTDLTYDYYQTIMTSQGIPPFDLSDFRSTTLSVSPISNIQKLQELNIQVGSIIITESGATEKVIKITREGKISLKGGRTIFPRTVISVQT